jgi:DNA-binding MarR family transcriptional regulator
MKWIRQIADYWKTEYPERNFARVRPLVRLSRLALLMPAYQKHVLKAHDLTPTDYSILGALRRAGRPRQLMPGDLYSTLGCTPGGLTKMVDRLEKRELVQRVSDREDGRRAQIRLTPKGEVAGRKAFEDYNDAAAQLMARLTEEELAHIDSALELLQECFEPADEPSYASPFAGHAAPASISSISSTSPEAYATAVQRTQ